MTQEAKQAFFDFLWRRRELQQQGFYDADFKLTEKGREAMERERRKREKAAESNG